ncbi:MAG TPA: carboxypeptidase-like regulatory domain-containing protein, partial [Gemmatimonadales bacterium]|nr:carboxypeptidase-like regulatory domain-containing protein [Gemmatimonadales bacterium]
MRTPLVLLSLFFDSAIPLASQAVMTGVVREDASGRALAGVQVVIEGSKRQATTDEAGRYLLEVPSGKRVALFRFVGYRPVRMQVMIGKRDTVQADALLVREAVHTLDPLVVTAPPSPARGSVLAGFEERRRLGFGKFIDSTELRRFEGRRLADVLRGLGVRIVPFQEIIRGVAMPDRMEYRAASPTAMDDNGGPCWVSVFLDGVPLYKSGSRSMRPPDMN